MNKYTLTTSDENTLESMLEDMAHVGWTVFSHHVHVSHDMSNGLSYNRVTHRILWVIAS